MCFATLALSTKITTALRFKNCCFRVLEPGNLSEMAWPISILLSESTGRISVSTGLRPCFCMRMFFDFFDRSRLASANHRASLSLSLIGSRSLSCISRPAWCLDDAWSDLTRWRDNQRAAFTPDSSERPWENKPKILVSLSPTARLILLVRGFENTGTHISGRWVGWKEYNERGVINKTARRRNEDKDISCFLQKQLAFF